MDNDTIDSRFQALSDVSTLEIFILRDKDYDVAGAISNGDTNKLQSLQRRYVFLDENATITILLKTAFSKEDVRDLLNNLNLHLVSHATDAVPQASGTHATATGKFDLSTIDVAAGSARDIVTVDDQTCVVWATQMHLSRPRTRIQRPAVYFTANLTVAESAVVIDEQAKVQYLTSLEPLPANILEPLQHDPALAGSQICIRENRIIKVAPVSPNLSKTTKSIRGSTARAYPAVPAVYTRIRYSYLAKSIVASLHIEASPIVSGSSSISHASLDLPGAEIQCLNPGDISKSSRPGDEVVLLYRISPTTSTDRSHSVAIEILGSVGLPEGLRADLAVKWQAQVNTALMDSVHTYKWLPRMISSPERRPLSSQTIQEATQSLDEKLASQDRVVPHYNDAVVFTFTRPKNVLVEQQIQLSIQCINQSHRQRRFALAALIPKARLGSHRATSSTASTSTRNSLSLSQTFVSDQHARPAVLDMVPEVRIGPLGPGACHNCILRYRPCKSGVIDLGSIRIVDLESKQIVDVRELPNILVTRRHD